MKYVDLVVRRGRSVRCDGKLYAEGQSFRAPPRKARLLVTLGRAQIDPAATAAPAMNQLPKPTRSDIAEVAREQREPASPGAETQQIAPRRRQYRRRDMVAQTGAN